MSGRFSVLGHDIAWETRGEGRPVVFVHGLASSRRVLVETCEPVLEPLGKFQRVYVDLPGHGESRGDPATASADHLVGALATLVGVVAPGAALVGHAYGAYLVQGLLRDVPSAGAFLLCPVVEPDFGRRRLPPRRVIGAGDLPFVDDVERAGFEEAAVVWSVDALERFRRVVHPANRAADRELVAVTREHYAMSRPYVAALAGYDRPVAIVCGRDDHWAGFEDAVMLVRTLPNASFTVVPGCGPLLPLEAPATFARLLVEWLERL